MPKLWAKGLSAAHAYTCEQLSRSGFHIIDTPDDTTQGVLLDIPSFRAPDVNPETIWAALPDNTQPKMRTSPPDALCASGQSR